MEREFLERERINIGKRMSSTMLHSFRRTRFQDDHDDLVFFDRCEQTITFFEDLFAKYNEEDLAELLRGDFAKDYMGDIEDFNTSKVPLYFYVDIIISTIKKDYLRYPQHVEKSNELISKLQSLRTKLEKYNTNKYFSPEKTMSLTMLESIHISKGNFSITYKQVHGQKYLNIKSISSYEAIEYRNGEYLSNGVSYTHRENLAYEEDIELIKKQEIDMSKALYQRVNDVCGKYFIAGKLPFDNFHKSLITVDMDERIRVILFTISSLIKDKTILSVSSQIEAYLQEIAQREAYLLKEEQERLAEIEHTSAIEKARARYRSKNFLWKLINRKLNPDRLSIDGMTTEKINSLYGGTRK